MFKPEWKIIITLIYIIMLFMTNTWIGYGIIFCTLFITCAIVKFSFYDIIKILKTILPLLIVIAVINMFFISGDTIFSWNFIRISKEGIEIAAKMLTRITFLIIGSSILTHVATPLELAARNRNFNEAIKQIKISSS